MPFGRVFSTVDSELVSDIAVKSFQLTIRLLMKSRAHQKLNSEMGADLLPKVTAKPGISVRNEAVR